MGIRRPLTKSAGERGGRTGNFARRPAPCPFCKAKIGIDYKDVSSLSQFISPRGKINPRRRTKACARHQRCLAQAIKRARFLALLPYAPEHIMNIGGLGSRR